MIAFALISLIALVVLILFPCVANLHHWDGPGGHCIDCGKCDEFFGRHKHCRKHHGETDYE